VNISIDSPSPGATVATGGTLDVGGWAADITGSTPGIDKVDVYLDGPMDGGGTLIGTATYGAARPDVATTMGNVGLGNSGYNYTWTVSNVSPGNHTLYVYAHAPLTGWWSQSVSVSVGGQDTSASTNDGSQMTYSNSPTYQQGNGMPWGMVYQNLTGGQQGYQANGMAGAQAGYPYGNAAAGNPYAGSAGNPYAGMNTAAYNPGVAGMQNAYAGAGYPQGYGNAPYGSSANGGYGVSALAQMFGNGMGQYPVGYQAMLGNQAQYGGQPYGYGNPYQGANPYGYQTNPGYQYPSGYPTSGYPYGYPQ
jgi:hypothetical protein